MIAGLLAGVINGMLGAGSGNVIVPFLEKYGIEERKAHATSVFIVFFFCVCSSFFYFNTGQLNFKEALPYAICGIPGAFIGTFILSKINQTLLRRIFSIFVIWAGSRMLFK
ncbi:MAG: sulfite exporter TauE/SafE family protein [Oscillospiraceae bacterium]|nr:sulfite exporter TauE/SafE family protein [Oscillospiraceae bacterium]